MAKFGQTNIMVGGGGSSDECTAKLSDIPEGLTAITSDSNDEPGRGTMRLTGTADPNEVLQGEIFYSTDYKKKQIGTMINGNIPDPKIGGISDTYPEVGIQRGTNAQFSMTTVSKEKLFAISPEKDGYFAKGNGYIGIPANELGLANPFQVLQGCTFTSAEGINIAGQMTVNSIMSFELAGVSGRQILFQWRNPTPASGKPYSSIFINYSTSGYPGTGGTRLYTGFGNNSNPGGLSQLWANLPALGTTYYFSAYAYAQTSAGDIYSQEFRAVGTTGGVITNTYTSSQNVTVPAGFTHVDIFCAGGGGGGGRGYGSTSNIYAEGGGGGGGGYTNTAYNVSVNQGEVLNCIIGAGGTGAQSGYNYNGKDGSITSVSRNGVTLCTANGGRGGQSDNSHVTIGAKGGSDGGEGAYNDYDGYKDPGGNGGSDGNPGQGRTTRAFGESWNTIYCGGGGGGDCDSGLQGAGGAGGGGAGGSGRNPGNNGVPNTGGGGGGGGGNPRYRYSGGNGASGVVLIRFK